MGILTKESAEKLAADTYMWLVENAKECLKLGEIGLITLIAVLAQYLYGKYYDKGQPKGNGRYYIDANEIRKAVKTEYSNIAYSVIDTRNALMHYFGSQGASDRLRYIEKHIDELKSLITHEGLKVE